MYPDMEIVDIVPGKQHKFIVQKYKDELGRPYSKIDLYLCKAGNVEENWTLEIVHLRTGLKGSSIQMLFMTTQFLLKISFVPH